MAYEFSEIRFLKDEGSDWWMTLQKVPIKILDQDFGTEVPLSDLTDSLIIEAPDADGTSSSSGDKQDVPESEKKLSLDSFRRKADAMKETGYSRVTVEKTYFEAEIFSKQFDKRAFFVRFEKGFLIIFATGQSTEGDATVWRKFERRYMLPHDCYISYNNFDKQVVIEYIEGGIKVRVNKLDQETSKMSLQQHPALKAAGRSPSPKKSPKRETRSSPLAPKTLGKENLVTTKK